MARAKGRSSSPIISSGSRNRRSTISPVPAPTWPPIGACSASPDGGKPSMVDATSDARTSPPLRLGMVGGGRGAFIGAVHRLCARMDGQFELVAGALSSDAQRARDSGADLGLAPDRVYTSFAQMAAAEAGRPDSIEVVSIVTPNDSHHAIARAFLDRGIDVICDKPMTTTVEDAVDLVQAVRRSGLVFGLTHNRSEEHTSELQSREKLVCRLLLEKKKKKKHKQRNDKYHHKK